MAAEFRLSRNQPQVIGFLKRTTMKKFYSILISVVFGTALNAQIVNYYVPSVDLIGMVMNSGDVCFNPMEYKQASVGNTWGFSWVSTNSNTPSSITVYLQYAFEEGAGPYPTTLNASADNAANPPVIPCGGLVTYTLTPANYIPLGTNTFLMDYATATAQQNQIIPGFPGTTYAWIEVDYTPVGCNDPDVPTLSALPNPICEGNSATISTTGNLNDATEWYLYSASCGGTPEQNNGTGVFTVSPSTTTTYYVRGEGGCVTPGACGSIIITVNPNADATIDPVGTVCLTDMPINLTAVDPGGTWSGTGIVDTVNGTFDPALPPCGTYPISYTISGSCGDTDTTYVTLSCLDDASFNYSAASYCADEADPTPTITGLPGGTFSASPAGLTISSANGVIDLDASTAGTYNVTYTTNGSCPNSAVRAVTVVALPDAGVTQAGAMLTADNSSATYQWLDCDNSYAIITGETGQIYNATANGNYAVEVTEGGCKDTSACINVTGIGMEESFTDDIRVYPNPSNGEVTIELAKEMDGTQIELINSLGQVVTSVTANGSNNKMQVANLTKGVYFIVLTHDDKTVTSKLVVK